MFRFFCHILYKNVKQRSYDDLLTAKAKIKCKKGKELLATPAIGKQLKLACNFFW